MPSDSKAGRPLGATGETVRTNIKRVRESQRMAVTELSARMGGLGRSIPPLGIRRIEDGQRRVDVDDLAAFAVALGVSPLSLLIPDSSDPHSPVSYTAVSGPITAGELADWIRIQFPLPGTTSVLEFWSRALPSWMSDGMVAALQKTNRDSPVTDEDQQRFWGTDGDDQ